MGPAPAAFPAPGARPHSHMVVQPAPGAPAGSLRPRGQQNSHMVVQPLHRRFVGTPAGTQKFVQPLPRGRMAVAPSPARQGLDELLRLRRIGINFFFMFIWKTRKKIFSCILEKLKKKFFHVYWKNLKKNFFRVFPINMKIFFF